MLYSDHFNQPAEGDAEASVQAFHAWVPTNKGDALSSNRMQGCYGENQRPFSVYWFKLLLVLRCGIPPKFLCSVSFSESVKWENFKVLQAVPHTQLL